ncbi:MAG: nucleotidyl transferase AbiEii/AbiGii toxin family protein [Deltaproteobacteria bacterium]|nr:nucleotidyl transferase AbiEii/AbiGii toxin family protein [Deltaproteobacteria bacterium]
MTTDLDLFTLDDAAFERGRHVVADVAAALGATLEVRQDAPGFKRFALTRGDEAVIVDLVRERARQVVPEKPEHDGVRVDPPEEILANKLTTLVSRMEERDLVDVLCLERAGYRVEQALDAALAKDGGCTAATLAWLLSEIRIPDAVRLPGAVSAAELRAFVVDLVGRLRRAAAPGAVLGPPG